MATGAKWWTRSSTQSSKSCADNDLEATVTGREKNLYSIYSKMREKNLSFAQVLDIYGFRVIVKDMPACYLALGALHGLYKPIPGKFKDYIAIPKANGYQSLHTTLFGPFGNPIEIQIRTQEMHKIAEAGVASHWLYKEHRRPAHRAAAERPTSGCRACWKCSRNRATRSSSSSTSRSICSRTRSMCSRPRARSWRCRMARPASISLTPCTPTSATAASRSKINHELMPLRTELKNGDRVEIITAAHAKPNPAVAELRRHRQSALAHPAFPQDHAVRGVGATGRAAAEPGAGRVQVRARTTSPRPQWERLLKETSAKSRQEVLADIGLGKQLAIVIARQLLLDRANRRAARARNCQAAVIIRGSEGMAVQFAKCCHPIPGDPIIGFMNKGHGMIIHTHDCPVARKTRGDPEKWLDVEWAPDTKKLFYGEHQAGGVEPARRAGQGRGAMIAETDSNIENVSLEPGDSSAYTDHPFHLAGA